jgi:hypothetical protein
MLPSMSDLFHDFDRRLARLIERRWVECPADPGHPTSPRERPESGLFSQVQNETRMAPDDETHCGLSEEACGSMSLWLILPTFSSRS